MFGHVFSLHNISQIVKFDANQSTESRLEPRTKGEKQTDIYEREASSSLPSKVVLPEIEVKRLVKFFPIRKGKQKRAFWVARQGRSLVLKVADRNVFRTSAAPTWVSHVVVDSGGKTRILTKKHWNRWRTIKLLIRGSGIHTKIHLILPVRKVRKNVQPYNSSFMFSYIQHLQAHEINRYLRAIKNNAIKIEFYNGIFLTPKSYQA